MFKKIFLCLASLVFSGAAFSYHIGWFSQCAYLRVVIINESNVDCFLVNKELKAGAFYSSPSVWIKSNQSKGFTIGQENFYGPDVTLSYQCGAQTIIFNSQQNYCFLSAGDITAAILNSPQGIKVTHSDVKGGYGEEPGLVTWKIENS